MEDRLERALDYVEDYGIPITALVVVGGVAANKELRRRLFEMLEKRTSQVPVVFPPVELCTDNGVMAAWAGIEKLTLGITDAIEGQEVQARWPLGEVLGSDQLEFRRKIKKTSSVHKS